MKFRSNARQLGRWLFSLICLATFAAAQTPTPERRPLKVGLVLSGGGARGLAHVGVLEWFEQHRIPVDYIAGTSMGGLIGAMYAMGAAPEELRPFLKKLNWDELFSRGPGYESLSFRRKDDRRNFQTAIEVGLRQGLTLPLGLSSAHYIGLLIDRLTLPYAGIKSFDELPIPYRTVATDFLAARAVVLKGGSLSTAMRATMSIPGVFPPIRRDGQTLVDGGLLNNIPTDVIKELQPDIIIVVDVGTKLGDLKTISSLAGILQQSITVMTIENDRRNLRLADIIVAPELGDLSTLDFSEIDKTADAGYQAAASKAAILARFALSEDEWQQHLAARRARRRTQTPDFAAVRINSGNEEEQDSLRRKFTDYAGQPLDPARLEGDLTKVTGQGRYESLDYSIVPDPQNPARNLLEIRVHEKTYAPPTTNFGLEIDGADVNDINFTIGTRLTLYDLGSYGAEWRTDVKLGFNNLFATEYFKPYGERGLFIAPRAAYRREQQGLFIGRMRLAEYAADRSSFGFDVGRVGRRSELRLGYEYAYLSARSRTGLDVLPPVEGSANRLRARFVFDGQDSPTVPSRGSRLAAEGSWFFNAPNAAQSFPQVEVRHSSFVPVRTRGSLFMAAAAGTTFNRTAPPFQQFLLGGPFRLGAYERDELRVNHYFLGTAGYLHKLMQLPTLVGGNVYAAGWLDQTGSSGGLTAIFDRQSLRAALSLGVVLDTKLGPFSIVGSYGEGGRGKVYFALGRFF